MARLRALLDDKDGKPWLTDVQITREENYPRAGRRSSTAQKAGDAGAVRAAGGADRAHQPGRQHAVRADPVHRREDRQRVLHQRAARRRVPLARRRHVASCSCARPAGGMVPLDTIAQHRARQRPGRHQPQVPAAHHRRHRQRRAGQGPGRRQRRRCRRVLDELPPPEGFTRAAGRPDRGAAEGVRRPVVRGDPGDRCSSTWCWRRSSSR